VGWAQEEFETIDLSDVRLNTRAALLAQSLADKPGESIPNACQGKHGGEPGAKTLWLGMRELTGFVRGLRLAKLTL